MDRGRELLLLWVRVRERGPAAVVDAGAGGSPIGECSWFEDEDGDGVLGSWV